MERLDLGKIIQSLRLLVRVVRELTHHKDAALYVPISQAHWALLRDGVALYVARAMRRNRIVHLHGGYLTNVLEHKPILRRFLAGATKGHTVGWVLTERLRSQLQHLVPDGSVYVLANAVADPFDVLPRDEPPPRCVVHLAFLSTLAPEKGHDLTLAALELLSRHRSEFSVRFAGGGAPEVVAGVRDRVSALAQAGWDIQYKGLVAPADRWRLLTKADILVMPTQYKYEGQPLVILEALACGCAVICTSHAGIPDTIDDGIEGLLVEPDADSLAKAILALAGSSEVLQEVKAAARLRYERMYSPDVFFGRVADLVRAQDSHPG